MPRGRPPSARLNALASTPSSQRDASPESSSAGGSARITRAASRRVSMLANEAVPSTTDSAGFTSTSDYSTPATSTEATPAPAAPSDDQKSGALGSRIEIPLPRRALTERESRNSIYSLNPRSRGNQQRVQTSGMDGDFRTASDELIAQRLQEEEYNKVENFVYNPESPLRSRHTQPSLPTKRKRDYVKNPPRKRKTYGGFVLDDTTSDKDADPSPNPGNEHQATGISQGGDETPASASTATRRNGLRALDDDADDTSLESDLSIPGASATTHRNEGLGRRQSGVRHLQAPSRPSRPSAATRRIGLLALGEDPDTSLESDYSIPDSYDDASSADGDLAPISREDIEAGISRAMRGRRGFGGDAEEELFEINGLNHRAQRERRRLLHHHPQLTQMWKDLENTPVLKTDPGEQPQNISRQLKPFQLEGVAWMQAMEQGKWKGGLLGDEMGLGKTIQAVSLIMSDFPAKNPSLVLVPPVALMQWTSEIESYTDGTLKTLVFHSTNTKTKTMTVKQLKQFHVIIMSYNSLESMYRKQEKGFKRKNGVHKEDSPIHQIPFHRVILDEAHCIKTRTTTTARACFALKANYRWCLTGTPLQNRIGELFSLLRFLNVEPFAAYWCKQCPCSSMEWTLGEDSRCLQCNHTGMQHVSVFNQELLNPIQKFGNVGPGREALQKLRLLTERIMLRRMKKDYTNAMELPVKEIRIVRQFFGEVETDFAASIMTNSKRNFETYVAQGVLLNNYANIFGLIMQMRQVADHPDLLLKKTAPDGQNMLVCCICDDPAESAIRSRCKHDFCRECAKGYVLSGDNIDCPQCHIALSIDLEQPEVDQDTTQVKKSSIINRINMEKWISSSKIEALVRELFLLRSPYETRKSIIFSQFTSMLQLIEWRLRRVGITTVMLDGTMTPAQRQASINHFMTDVKVEVFLVSLKAGGVALNLTEASRVFIVDPWWNPAAEWQSADRCHRIGQTRPCIIKRLCIEDSVESRMVAIQEKKTSMIHSTVNADDKAIESLSPEDMQFLFRGN